MKELILYELDTFHIVTLKWFQCEPMKKNENAHSPIKTLECGSHLRVGNLYVFHLVTFRWLLC